ncbi:1-aminocyclopropane-1-carboxylate synthase-like protein 1 [Dendronephthya gigantea]|uniref:1-aminocyclopropane-1-carboxylate synthase-like protein 1 n=1 Tax=Dendronephthya gigantea TaxID=151771 RepID=UPI00106B0E2C|nr:1-aminocyclopropane-1-carboxylate synthase-like protein 1 [Dendronephthya gigantea]
MAAKSKSMDEWDLSERCYRYVKMDFPLLDYMEAYLANPYDKEDNPEGIINMGTSENKIIADIVTAKLNEQNEFKEEHSHYGDFRGMPKFRESMAKFFERYMKPLEKIDPENIAVYNGCASIVKALSATIFNPGEAILMPTPYYAGFEQDLYIENEIVRFPVHLSSEPHPETNMPFEITMKALETSFAKATAQNLTVRGLMLCNPQNPLGTVYSEKQILECMEFAERHSLHIIADEIYMLSVFKEGSSTQSVLAVNGPISPERLHVVWGFSKDFGLSGVRAGAVYTRNKDILEALRRIAPFYAIATFLQAMLENLVIDYDWLDKVLIPTNHKRLRECHRVITEALKKENIPVVPSCSGLFVWIDLRQYLDTQSFEAEKRLGDMMLENAVYINAGKVFCCCEPGWYRVVIADDPAKIKIGIERVISTLKKFKA